MADRSEFELLGKVSIGQYIPTGSLMHRLDPRVKLLMGIFLIGTTIISSSFVSLMILFLAVYTGLFLTRVQVRPVFMALRSMIPFLFLIALIQIFAVPQLRNDASVIWKWRILTMTDRSLMAGIFLICRFIIIVIGLSEFSFSTSTTELIHGIEHLLRPLQKLRFPAHELTLVIAISIRFLPILINEAERLMKAQASRGADFGRGKGNFIRRLKIMLPLYIPLFIVSLRHAYSLAEAMESRCYMGGKGRTHLIRLQAGLLDYIVLSLGIGIVACVIIIGYLHIDTAIWIWIKNLIA